MEVKFDKYSLIVDGKRTFIKSGSIHYFRIFGEKEVIGKYIGKGDVCVVGTNNEGFCKKLLSMIDDN